VTQAKVAFEFEMGEDFEGFAKNQTKIIKVFMLPCAENCKANHQKIIYHIQKVDVK